MPLRKHSFKKTKLHLVFISPKRNLASEEQEITDQGNTPLLCTHTQQFFLSKHISVFPLPMMFHWRVKRKESNQTRENEHTLPLVASSFSSMVVEFVGRGVLSINQQKQIVIQSDGRILIPKANQDAKGMPSWHLGERVVRLKRTFCRSDYSWPFCLCGPRDKSLWESVTALVFCFIPA